MQYKPIKTAMWKMQSLKKTLTLAQLAPFFMLSPNLQLILEQ
jgi:hypothetical protein